MLRNLLAMCLHSPVYIVLFIITMSGCKKDEPVVEAKLPELGTCEPVQPKGRFTVSNQGQNVTYVTSGGGKIVVDPTGITITHKDFVAFNLLFWGETDDHHLSGAHESLIGKHIKDWKSNRRTVIFPDGAKITISTDGIKGPIASISIYDGADAHHFNSTCQTVEYSASTISVAQQLDNAEPDGETATFEFTSTGLLYFNIYTENTAGDKVENRVDLGEIYRDNPNHCDDYYDDPERGDT